MEFNIREQQLSVINVPESLGQGFLYLIGVEDGMLLFASVLKSRLYLWSMEAGPSKTAVWTRHRVIDLVPLLPASALIGVSVVGFAEGVCVIFLKTRVGLYTIQLKSEQSNQVHRGYINKVMPYMSFYIGGTD